MHNNLILTGEQPASLSGNTYQYESIASGPLSPASYQTGGRYIKFSRRRRGNRKSRKSRRRKSKSVRKYNKK